MQRPPSHLGSVIQEKAGIQETLGQATFLLPDRRDEVWIGVHQRDIEPGYFKKLG